MTSEEIIYIVITVVIFVISLFGKKKKKKPNLESENSEQAEYSLNDFEKILERTQITEQEKIEGKDEQYQEIEDEPIDHVSKNYHFTDDESSKKKEKEIIKSSKKEIENEDNENEDGFDLKSAIVYSSILERKKFRH